MTSHISTSTNSCYFLLMRSLRFTVTPLLHSSIHSISHCRQMFGRIRTHLFHIAFKPSLDYRLHLREYVMGYWCKREKETNRKREREKRRERERIQRCYGISIIWVFLATQTYISYSNMTREFATIDKEQTRVIYNPIDHCF